MTCRSVQFMLHFQMDLFRAQGERGDSGADQKQEFCETVGLLQSGKSVQFITLRRRRCYMSAWGFQVVF